LVTCTASNHASGELITGTEDRVARVFDANGRMRAESTARDFAVSSVVFFPSAKLCLMRTNNRLHLLNTRTIAAGAAVRTSPAQLRLIVAGNGTVALITVGKKVVFHDNEIFADSPRKLIVFGLKNGVSDTVQFAESIIDFHLNVNHFVRPK
jgi:hypothetical protein